MLKRGNAIADPTDTDERLMPVTVRRSGSWQSW